MHLITKQFLHIFIHLNGIRRRVALVSQLQHAKPVCSHLIAVSVAPPTDDGNLCVGQFNAFGCNFEITAYDKMLQSERFLNMHHAGVEGEEYDGDHNELS